MMNKYLYQAGASLLVVAFGTVLDYLVHHMDETLAVPFEYYPNKIIFGAFWFFVFLNLVGYVTSKINYQAVLVPLAVAVVLQAKYFFQGYPIWFVVLFLFLHFLMFLPASFWVFRRYGDFIKS